MMNKIFPLFLGGKDPAKQPLRTRIEGAAESSRCLGEVFWEGKGSGGPISFFFCAAFSREGGYRRLFFFLLLPGAPPPSEKARKSPAGHLLPLLIARDAGPLHIQRTAHPSPKIFFHPIFSTYFPSALSTPASSIPQKAQTT